MAELEKTENCTLIPWKRRPSGRKVETGSLGLNMREGGGFGGGRVQRQIAQRARAQLASERPAVRTRPPVIFDFSIRKPDGAGGAKEVEEAKEAIK